MNVKYNHMQCVELFTFFQGWIRHMRKQKHVNFIQLNDGTGKPAAQIVTSPEICSKYLKNFLFLNIVIQDNRFIEYYIRGLN